ncbi:MAG: hypothetical protein IPL26_12950 [Leptospiraceae bacterium]|nr:hypothetical protein [Leptospiraceae bacterium]
MKEVFEFTCFINPPTKNEKKTIPVYSKRAGRKVHIVSPAFKQVWELIHDEMYKAKFKMSKNEFKLLSPKKRAELERSLTEKDVRLNFWNGFHKIDLYNLHDEFLDRLQGIAYKNDRQVVEGREFWDKKSKREYFKIIIEEI